MENRDLRQIRIYFNTQEADSISIDNVNVTEFINDITTGYHDRFYEFPAGKEEHLAPRRFVNLDNITCIVIGRKQMTLEEEIDSIVPESLVKDLFPDEYRGENLIEYKMKAWDAYGSLEKKNHKKVIELRYGIFGKKPETLENTGKVFCVTRERVRTMETKAFGKMRDFIRSKDSENI